MRVCGPRSAGWMRLPVMFRDQFRRDEVPEPDSIRLGKSEGRPIDAKF